MRIEKIISGGQTGADRAALDAALELGIEIGGFVPYGRLAEDGVISERYLNLIETESADTNQRTEANVRHSDATLILTHGPALGGTAYTKEILEREGRPFLHIDFNTTTMNVSAQRVRFWLNNNSIQTLNVAGPRSSEDPKIYYKTKKVLLSVLATIADQETKYADIAITLYEQSLENFRHWDTVRWLVPNWYCTLAAAGIAVIPYFVEHEEKLIYVRIGAAFLSIFGLLSLLLLSNLCRYHNNMLIKHKECIEFLLSNEAIKRALTVNLPFEFDSYTIFKTATFWYGLFISIITIFCLTIAYSGLWWINLI